MSTVFRPMYTTNFMNWCAARRFRLNAKKKTEILWTGEAWYCWKFAANLFNQPLHLWPSCGRLVGPWAIAEVGLACRQDC